jgi:integral membrane protein (TIGR01906 family)
MAAPSAVPRPAPGGLAALLGVAMAVLILLTGPLLLFNPWFVSVEQARNDVPQLLATRQAEVDRVTGAMLCDLLLRCDDFGEALEGQAPLLTAAERSHMRDVSDLVRLLAVAWLAAALVAVATLVGLRRERRRIGRAMLGAGGIVGTLAILLAAFFAVDFEQAFLDFHEVFFPQGNFLFGPDSNLLRLFPEGFWFDASITAGIAIVLTAIAVLVAGWRLTRGSEPAAG